MIQNSSQPVAFIDRATDLAGFIASVGQPATLALDTEFARERTYFPRLCLIQLATAERIALVDALAIDDLSALTRLWSDPATTTILHAAAQDLEVLHHRTGALPARIFDTQIAAALTGHDAQTGYATLVQAELGVTLAKSHTRIDWQQRPLPDGALDYAADDVRYLAALYERLAAALAENERSDWLAEDCDRLNSAERYEPAPERSARYVRGLDTLDGDDERAIAARLAAWRERTAIDADRPRRWILADESILEIARRAPGDVESLNAIDSIPARTQQRHGEKLIDVIHRPAHGTDPDTPGAKTRPTPAERRRSKAGMAELKRLASTLGIASGVLGSRAEIDAMIAGRTDTRLQSGWRATVAGPAVAAAVAQPGPD